jgi:hypothetical protein
MANRSIRQLLNLALFDYRFYLGTIRDFSVNGNDAIWQAGMEPPPRRDIGGAVGLDFRLAGGMLITTPAGMTTAGEFAYEIMMRIRSAGDANAGRIMDPTDGNCTLRMNGNQFRIDCGAFWNIPVTPPRDLHLILTRDGADNGYAYYNGQPQGSAAVGGNDINAQIRIGNWAAGTRSFDGMFYSIRLHQDHIDADEAARLYEHSRIRLWPGAPKRSGIISPVV